MMTEAEYKKLECRTGGFSFDFVKAEGVPPKQIVVWRPCSGSACGHWLWTKTCEWMTASTPTTELPRDKWLGRCGLIHPEQEG